VQSSGRCCSSAPRRCESLLWAIAWGQVGAEVAR
jgi:hypothetical protein